MVQDILTKFNNKKRAWLTPKHSFYLRKETFKKWYGAALFLQAQKNKSFPVLNNPELERILKAGLGLNADQISQIIHFSREESAVIDQVSEQMISDREKVLFILDLLDVSYSEKGWDTEAEDWIDLWGRILGVFQAWVFVLRAFIESARKEEYERCMEFAKQIQEWEIGLSEAELKFYNIQSGTEMECTQSRLEQEKEIHLVDRCEIREDLTLKPGMHLIIDHAEVRVYGNIALRGGRLSIEHSKMIRKTGSHRACVNIHHQESSVDISNSEIDCRNYGMFLRAEFGTVTIADSRISRTTRGAAIRFWGEKIAIERVSFQECYSPDDGGALMLRGGSGIVQDCYFRDCEARCGGAIYSVEGMQIHHCHFEHCCVAEYGAAVYYKGMIGKQVHHLEYIDCCPSGAETVQYLYVKNGITVNRELHIRESTILDCELYVEARGVFVIEEANLYLNYPIYCKGTLRMKNVRVLCGQLGSGDMIVLDHAKQSEMYHCDFDGMLRTGAISATGTRLQIAKSIFRNTSGGRAVYNAYAPEISDSIFNFCQGGAIYAQSGTIRRCVFINCREKNGAGIWMYGTSGMIEQCNFKRCVADSRGGAVDRSAGHQVVRCLFEDCQPNNVS